jgi:hypothetical protein
VPRTSHALSLFAVPSRTISQQAPHLATWLCKHVPRLPKAAFVVNNKPPSCHSFTFLLRIACRSRMHACKNGKRVPSCGWCRIPARASDADSGPSCESSISSSHKKRGSMTIPSFQTRSSVSDPNSLEAYESSATSQQIQLARI